MDDTTSTVVEPVERGYGSPEREALPSPSSYPEFAHCFSFFKKFGPFLNLRDVTLNQLENFFKYGDIEDFDDFIVSVHYQLLSNIARRPFDKDNWIAIAAKLAYTNGYIEESPDYEDFDLHQRIQLLGFLCDMQFFRNSSFKNHLSKMMECDSARWKEQPVGLDQEGLRYWFLQDSTYNIRLYSEDKYLEYPFDHPKWHLICSSVEELDVFINQLEFKNRHDDKLVDMNVSATVNVKKRRISTDTKAPIGGCIICRKDNNYSKMLLCDKCDKECHTYCQYPILWSVPDGEWFCPLCRECRLIEKLRTLYDGLVDGLLMCEKLVEEEQKKIRRLQRGGLLVQNIITGEKDSKDDGAPRRSGRSKKNVNYALLNELNIHILPVYSLHRVTKRELKHFSSSTSYSTRRTRNNCITDELSDGVVSNVCENDDLSLSTSDNCQLEVVTECEQCNVEDIYPLNNDPTNELLCSVPLNSINFLPDSQSCSTASGCSPSKQSTTIGLKANCEDDSCNESICTVVSLPSKNMDLLHNNYCYYKKDRTILNDTEVLNTNSTIFEDV